MLPAGSIIAALYHKLETQSSAPKDGRNYRPKQVELIEIINKPWLLHLVGYLYNCIRDARSQKHPICRYFLALLWAHPILHISRIRVNNALIFQPVPMCVMAHDAKLYYQHVSHVHVPHLPKCIAHVFFFNRSPPFQKKICMFCFTHFHFSLSSC